MEQKVNRLEYLYLSDPFWSRYPAFMETVILANETGGITTVHKCQTKAEQRLEVVQDSANYYFLYRCSDCHAEMSVGVIESQKSPEDVPPPANIQCLVCGGQFDFVNQMSEAEKQAWSDAE